MGSQKWIQLKMEFFSALNQYYPYALPVQYKFYKRFLLGRHDGATISIWLQRE